ncbi:MAG: hypothetical protein IPJ65_21375 [Archangiaceae bacterium]|nr:hypothetical protein [Archangiaceae bacterium]
MLASLALLVCSQSVVVLDVSAEDAVYEDESRALALEVVDVLNAKGLVARRVDESELPPQGCRAGPCLEKVAHGSDALVTLDVAEISKGRLGVAITALAGRTGMPLAGGRYHVGEKTKRPAKELEAFAKKLTDVLTKAAPKKRDDAGHP